MSAWQGPNNDPQHQQPWQPPTQCRSSWQDPRLANQNSYQTHLTSAHAPVSPLQAYNIPHTPDGSNWGVNFNQAQQTGYPAGGKPPLPPRPDNRLAHNPSPGPSTDVPSWQAPAWPTQAQHAQLSHTPNTGHAAGYTWAPGFFSAEQSGSSVQNHLFPQPSTAQPPLPPPRPSAYQSQPQYDRSQSGQPQYSQHSGSYHYDPNTQAQSYVYQQPSQEPYPKPVQQSSISRPHTIQADQRPPVSPEEVHVMPWASNSQAQAIGQHSRIEPGSSALGAGGPSDWEHFQGSVGSVDEENEADTINVAAQFEKLSPNDQFAELPANFSPTASKRASLPKESLLDAEFTTPTESVGEVPIREQSVSPDPSGDGLQRTATIDGLIQEWSTPLNRGKAAAESRSSSVSTLDQSRRDANAVVRTSPRQPFHTPDVRKHHDKITTSEHDSLTRSDSAQSAGLSRILTRQNSLAQATISTKTIEVDPYADLGPESRASLARYATMLRKEEGATEEEKYKIFKAFVLKENRLRCILYNVDPDEPELPIASQVRMPKVEHEAVVAEAMPHSADASSLQPAKVPAAATPDLSRELPSKLTIETTPTSNEDSYVVVERDGESEYSPGGRPSISRNPLKRTVSHPPPHLAPKQTYSPSDYAPILVEETPQSSFNQTSFLARAPLQRPGTAPLASQNSTTSDSFKFEPSRPAYTPFRYVESPQPEIKPSFGARPAYQAYSALRHQSEDSGRVMTQSIANSGSLMPQETLVSPNGNSARRDHEEAFLGLIRERSRAYRVGKQLKAPSALANKSMLRPEAIDHETPAINALRELIPSNMPQQRQATLKIVEAKNAMSKYPDVFSWIPDTVIRWDRQNKVLRTKQEQERQKRQEESENHIDALFNDHEIGYSDIGQLEADFKLAEATKQYDEDVEELDSFTDKVFKPVTERLREELFQLNAQYIRAVDLLELEADSGQQYLLGDGNRTSRAEAMDVVLALYNKLQIRHVKRAEANYERERRRKKLEVSVLYTNGDSAAMTKLETVFARAEREQSLHEAREKDSRANKLMDIFDRATVRGLGDNQQSVDDVVAKLEGVNDLLKDKQGTAAQFLPPGLRDLLRQTEELLDYVASDSRSLLRLSSAADNMLNTADYDVSVAEAKVANATPESMRILAEEKGKEDERLNAEVETRMGSVAKGPDHALSLVKNIMKRLGDDPQHHDRVQKALEAAKLRNASKTPVG